jgi:hypothetical protein
VLGTRLCSFQMYRRNINSTWTHESLFESDSTEGQVGLHDDKVASRNARARPTDLPNAASFEIKPLKRTLVFHKDIYTVPSSIK